MRSASSLAKLQEPAARPDQKPVGAFALVWMLLQQIWTLACRGEFRGLDDMLADAGAQLVLALRGMMADDPAYAHLAGLHYRLEFNGRDYDLVPVGGWSKPPTRFEDHESSALSLAWEILDARRSWGNPAPSGPSDHLRRFAREDFPLRPELRLPPLAGEVPAKPGMGASRRTGVWGLPHSRPGPRWDIDSTISPPSPEILGTRYAWPRMTPAGHIAPFIRAGPRS